MARKTKNSSVKEEPKDEVIDVEDESTPAVFVAPRSSAQSCVMILPDDALTNTDSTLSFVKLPNPKTNVENLYAFAKKDTVVYEINQIQEGKRSWFVNDSVVSKGMLSICTQIDPLFLILPFVMKVKYAGPLDQLLMDEQYPEAVRLATCVKKEQMEKIADCKANPAFEAWKYNETKTIEMLDKKLRKISQHLKDSKVNVTETAVAVNYVKVSSDVIPESSYLRYAHGIISEYLSEELSGQLEKHFDLPPVQKSQIVKDEVQEPPHKKQKLNPTNSSEPIEDYSKEGATPIKEKAKQQTAKEKALASAAKGTRSIASFFSKK